MQSVCLLKYAQGKKSKVVITVNLSTSCLTRSVVDTRNGTISGFSPCLKLPKCFPSVLK